VAVPLIEAVRATYPELPGVQLRQGLPQSGQPGAPGRVVARRQRAAAEGQAGQGGQGRGARSRVRRRSAAPPVRRVGDQPLATPRPRSASCSSAASGARSRSGATPSRTGSDDDEPRNDAAFSDDPAPTPFLGRMRTRVSSNPDQADSRLQNASKTPTQPLLDPVAGPSQPPDDPTARQIRQPPYFMANTSYSRSLGATNSTPTHPGPSATGVQDGHRCFCVRRSERAWDPRGPLGGSPDLGRRALTGTPSAPILSHETERSCVDGRPMRRAPNVAAEQQQKRLA